MSVDFNKILSVEQRVKILEDAVQSLAADGYRHKLNKKVGEQKKDEELVFSSQNAIDTIEAAIVVYQEELSSIS